MAAAQFYVARENSKDAQKELKLALDGNPSDAKCFELLGLIALDEFNFDGADKAISMIRRVDRRSTAADLLESRNLLHQRRPKMPRFRCVAYWIISRRISKPWDCWQRHLRCDWMKSRLTKSRTGGGARSRQCHRLFRSGRAASAMRQYPRAEKMYRKAIERAAWWSAARNGLGLLLTQSGDEENAKSVLDAAYSIDPSIIAQPTI